MRAASPRIGDMPDSTRLVDGTSAEQSLRVLLSLRSPAGIHVEPRLGRPYDGSFIELLSACAVG
jgi:hypothetical protein